MSEETASGSEDAGGPPRLMITKIVCENFKSYAGTKVLGPFHKVSCFLVKYSEGGGNRAVHSSSSLPFSASRPLSGPMGVESRTSLTQCCLSSATAPPRYAARRCLC